MTSLLFSKAGNRIDRSDHGQGFSWDEGIPHRGVVDKSRHDGGRLFEVIRHQMIITIHVAVLGNEAILYKLETRQSDSIE